MGKIDSSTKSLYPRSLRVLVNELSKLPSIGRKSAQRLAYHLVVEQPESASLLAASIESASKEVELCERCHFLADSKLCSICSDDGRDPELLCVVEKPADVLAIEKTSRFEGRYHVLHGLWSPSVSSGADDKIRLASLFERILNQKEVKEVLIATGTTVEGDATALYIANVLREAEVKASRIAQGMPMGGELEYADEITIIHAIEDRKRI